MNIHNYEITITFDATEDRNNQQITVYGTKHGYTLMIAKESDRVRIELTKEELIEIRNTMRQVMFKIEGEV